MQAGTQASVAAGAATIAEWKLACQAWSLTRLPPRTSML
jgi:hypothetical protein